MGYNSNNNLTKRAQELRKGMTPQERKLWYEFLKLLPYTVKRQYVVDNYILDFYCDRVKIAIELDGSQHYEEKEIAYDAERSKVLDSLGIKVLRYSNSDVNKNFDGVCSDILSHFGLTDIDVEK